jgi:hypothetical protein
MRRKLSSFLAKKGRTRLDRAGQERDRGRGRGEIERAFWALEVSSLASLLLWSFFTQGSPKKSTHDNSGGREGRGDGGKRN